MLITNRPLIDARQTGRLMHKMVKLYYWDMAPWVALSPPDFFNVMAKLPFNPDPDNIEFIKRPFFTMNRIGPGGDCDDKSIAIAAWAKLSGYPYRFKGVGNKKSNKKRILLSHVYPEVYIWGKWIPFDATYGFNIFGKAQSYDRMELL